MNRLSPEKWRAGESLPRYENLVRLAEVLDKSPDWFYAEHVGSEDEVAA